MKRARYHGASGTGVDLTVTLPDGQYRNVHVPQGDLTPETVDGQPFPEAMAESLAEQDGWTLETDKPTRKAAPDAAEKPADTPAGKE